jgi:hypothetical protein
MDILEGLDLTPETEANWSTLSEEALRVGSIHIAGKTVQLPKASSQQSVVSCQ